MKSTSVFKETHFADIQSKVKLGLVTHLYREAKSSVLASLFCASVLFYGLDNTTNHLIDYWFYYTVIITIGRCGLLTVFFKGGFNIELHISLWRNLFLLGCILGSLAWGIMSYLIFPGLNETEKILTILVLAGITAGGTPSLAADKTSVICFLWLILLPLVIQISHVESRIYSLFDLTIIIYLFYLTLHGLRMNKTLKDLLKLKYENVALLEKLKYLATHDPLTNLDNVRLFYDNLSSAMDRAQSKKVLVALLYIDLDKFKAVNDNHGHVMGDKVLKHATEIIRCQLRPNDFFARLGGDEFAVIIEEVVNKDHIIHIAKRICDEICKPMLIDGVEINVSASVGISLYPIHGKNVDTLIKSADHAMYFVKKNGANNYTFSRSDH